MLRRSRWVTTGLLAGTAILFGPLSENLFAQDATMESLRPGGYLSWIKLAALAGVFLVWVRMADWINRDAMKIGEKTEMHPEVWNPIVAFSFLIGFMVAISVPIFAAGYPVYCVAALLPFLIYFFKRRKKMFDDPNLMSYVKAKPGDAPVIEALPQDEGVKVDFSPAGADGTEKQANLIRARQTIGFTELKELISQAQFKRAEQILMDYTQESVSLRIFVDGAWHAFEPMDRELGDAVLVSLKHLAGMNHAERRARQSGKIGIKSDLGKADLVITSQGVPTGERVQVKFQAGKHNLMKLDQLGMFPKMLTTVKESLNTARTTIISAPPSGGLTSTWQGALFTADRLTRDCIGIVDEENSETAIENIVIKLYDENAEDKDQYTVTRAVLLSQPDMLAVPKIESAKVLDMLTEQVLKQDRALALVTPAKSAAEALLRFYAKAGNREQFLDSVHSVTCQRLVRRLCDSCKVEVRVQPKMIQQLGGNPKTQGTLFNQWQLPPPDQRVDEKGNPIEFPPCRTCGGIGYIGRIAVFELITLNDQLRDHINKNPKIASVEAAATKLGKKSLAQNAYQLVLLGVTSIAEVQMMMKQK